MSLFSNSKVPSFNDWVKAKGYAPNGKWVLAKRTPRTLARYPDSTFFTQKRYDQLVEEHRVEQRAEIIQIGLEQLGHGMSLASAMMHIFEAGRAAR